MNIVRVVLDMVTHFGQDLHQLDMKNVFLHGNLEKEMYMEILLRFEIHSGRNMVCFLKKALNGLEQSPRA